MARFYENEPLAPRTTLGVGGAAQRLYEVSDPGELVDLVCTFSQERQPFVLLGGGSNVVVSDTGLSCAVVHPIIRGITVARRTPDVVEVTAAAGEPWDDFVAFCVDNGWSGLECLSGIPGLVGAAPIQNIGAYGQAASDTICRVHCLDRTQGELVDLSPTECAFGYRTSVFKRDLLPRYIVLSASFVLRRGAPEAPDYGEVTAELNRLGHKSPSVAELRAIVLSLRRRKSMVLDAADGETRSAGSFFLNPLLAGSEAERVEATARRRGVVEPHGHMPRFALPPEENGTASERIKVPAGWLIERAGFCKGYTLGPVGLSQHHALVLVNRGGAKAADVIALAQLIRDRVHETFGITLEPEPVFLGFAQSPLNPIPA